MQISTRITQVERDGRDPIEGEPDRLRCAGKFLLGHEAGKEIGALPGLGAGKESWEFLF